MVVRRGPAHPSRAATGRVRRPASAEPAATRDAAPPTCRRAGPRKPKKRHNGRRIFGFIVLAWIVFLVAVPWWAWGQIEKVDASPDSGRPADQPGTTYLLVGSDSRRGLTKEEQKELHDRRRHRRSRPHRHDHAPAHRQRPQHPDVAPPRLARRHPRLRTHQDQCRVRVRRSQAARPDDRGQHRHPGGRLHRGRLRRPGQGRRLPRRRRDLPQGAHQGQGLRPRRPEGLPERRRQDRARVLPQPSLVRHAGHPARAEPARGARARSPPRPSRRGP